MMAWIDRAQSADLSWRWRPVWRQRFVTVSPSRRRPACEPATIRSLFRSVVGAVASFDEKLDDTGRIVRRVLRPIDSSEVASFCLPPEEIMCGPFNGFTRTIKRVLLDK